MSNSFWAKEVFSILKDMERLFALGHGRSLHRSVCEVVGMDWLLPLTPGSTRMITYCGDTPGRFLKNFRSYYFGMVVEKDHAEEGRGSFSKKELVDVGRKLGRIQVVVFAMGMAEVFEAHIQPYARETQAARTLQWVRYRSQQRMLEAFRLAEDSCHKCLKDWRIYFFVHSGRTERNEHTVLLGVYASFPLPFGTQVHISHFCVCGESQQHEGCSPVSRAA